METEKHVILREMEEVEKSKDEVIFDRLHMTAFRDSSLGFTILGPEENIRNMKRQHLIDYINANYTTDRMVYYNPFRCCVPLAMWITTNWWLMPIPTCQLSGVEIRRRGLKLNPFL